MSVISKVVLDMKSHGLSGSSRFAFHKRIDFADDSRTDLEIRIKLGSRLRLRSRLGLSGSSVVWSGEGGNNLVPEFLCSVEVLLGSSLVAC